MVSERDVQQRCTNCVDFAQPCTFARAVKRRGVKPKDRAVEDVEALPSTDPLLQPDIGTLNARYSFLSAY